MNLKRLCAGVVFGALALPAFAHDVIYIATLDGASEAPPNASTGSGFATLTINEDNFTMRLEASFSGLVGNVTNAHIHCCTTNPGASTAGVATPVPTFPGFPSGATLGVYDRTFDMTQPASFNPAFVNANGGTTGSAFNALLAGVGSGRAYLNIHTTSVPGGEIRGFFALAPIPEPETYALMLAGLGLVGVAARRAQRTTA